MGNEERLGIFERKLMRIIYSPIWEQSGIWRARITHELDRRCGHRFVKARRLAWFGHVIRTEESRFPKKKKNNALEANRKEKERKA